MPSADINYLAVLFAAILSMIIGSLWYSPFLFAKPWLKLVGKKEKDLREGATAGYIVSTVGFLLLSYVMAHFIYYTGADTLVEGLEVGFWLWLGFVATTSAINYAYGQRPRDLWVIDTGYFLVSLLASAALLAVWI